jgi:nitroreductase
MTEFNLAEIDRLLSTTKSVRRRLDLTRSVPRQVVVESIRLGCFAPNASNAQEWRWVVVDDAEQRRLVGEQYAKVTIPSVTQMLESKLSHGDEVGARISRSIIYLAEHMAEVPVIVFPCYDVEAADLRYQTLITDPALRATPSGMNSGMYASIYPAVWSFQLALRSRGLGSVFTSAHQRDQPAMAEILGIPGSWDQTCMIPVAYTTGGDFRPSLRDDVNDHIFWNRYETSTPTLPSSC